MNILSCYAIDPGQPYLLTPNEWQTKSASEHFCLRSKTLRLLKYHLEELLRPFPLSLKQVNEQNQLG